MRKTTRSPRNGTRFVVWAFFGMLALLLGRPTLTHAQPAELPEVNAALRLMDPDVIMATPSKSGGAPSIVVFTNFYWEPIDIFWVGLDGTLRKYGTPVRPMESSGWSSFEAHAWIAVDSKTGKPIAGVVVDQPGIVGAYIFPYQGVPREVARAMAESDPDYWYRVAASLYKWTFKGLSFTPCSAACAAASDFYEKLGKYLECRGKPIDAQGCEAWLLVLPFRPGADPSKVRPSNKRP
jgi:hypothetical protein